AHGKSPKCLDGNLGDFGEFCKGLNLSMVVLRGTVTFNGKEQATAGELVNFEQTGGKVRAKAGSEEAKILLLSGVPIDEPVVGYGPFVMNTAEEIRQAISDFKSGKFGRID
ncbi:pirin-like C-terminal cupin domain-containing protein, partial [uncultured Neisseria sp.]|uniref:pirin-like C-terminal cupin domain-containing protein n=1 Tax=uncultured Neisseria sp. TaxID=237778 RepID=UPI0025F127DA